MSWLRKTFSEQSSASASRQIMAVVVATICVCLFIDARRNGISPYWAAVATGVTGTLGAVWWKGKGVRNGAEQ